MKGDDSDSDLVIKMSSAMFSTLLAPFVGSLAVRSWNEWRALILAYILTLVLSGWAFAFMGLRVAGFINSALMLGIAGFCFYYSLGDMATPLADNPAAGLVATAALIYLLAGVIAAALGLGVGYILLKKPDHTDDPKQATPKKI